MSLCKRVHMYAEACICRNSWEIVIYIFMVVAPFFHSDSAKACVLVCVEWECVYYEAYDKI